MSESDDSELPPLVDASSSGSDNEAASTRRQPAPVQRVNSARGRKAAAAAEVRVRAAATAEARARCAPPAAARGAVAPAAKNGRAVAYEDSDEDGAGSDSSMPPLEPANRRGRGAFCGPISQRRAPPIFFSSSEGIPKEERARARAGAPRRTRRTTTRPRGRRMPRRSPKPPLCAPPAPVLFSKGPLSGERARLKNSPPAL